MLHFKCNTVEMMILATRVKKRALKRTKLKFHAMLIMKLAHSGFLPEKRVHL